MSDNPSFERPHYHDAVDLWKQLLAEHGLPREIQWILDENLCFQPDPSSKNGVRLAYQTRFTAPPPEVAERTYSFFSDFEARIVFYCIGTSHDRSVCMILCDPVFEERGEADGYVRRDDWKISFCPGTGGEIEEVVDEERWKRRIVRGRPLSDLDFCLPMDVLRELDVHGRPLTTYERFGVKMLDAWQRWNRER